MRQKQEFFTAMGGRVKFIRGNYNITSDPIWLAWFVKNQRTVELARPHFGASVTHRAVKKRATTAKLSVLDAGIGTGGAALALLTHIPNARITGIDISETILAECAKNAELNDRQIDLVQGDIITWRTDRTFDIVMTNPPYFRGTPRTGIGNSGIHHNADLNAWTRACLRRVRPRGYFVCIIDTAMLVDVIAALYAGKAGDVEILPLFGMPPASTDRHAERVLVRARLGICGGTKILDGMLMNDDNVLKGEK